MKEHHICLTKDEANQCKRTQPSLTVIIWENVQTSRR